MAAAFLRKAAIAVKDTCPGLSRHLMSLYPLPARSKSNEEETCPFCFQIRLPGNHKVRLKPKMRITPQIDNLLKKEGRCHRLNLKQTRLLRKYRSSRSYLVVTCNTCNMVSKYPGESRVVTANRPGTPKAKSDSVSPHLRKAGLNQKVNLSYSEEKRRPKNRTPRLCASASASPVTAARSSKKGKFHFSRLKMMLSQEEKEPNIKQNLLNFLTSLS